MIQTTKHIPFVLLTLEPLDRESFKAFRPSTNECGTIARSSVPQSDRERVRQFGKARVTVPSREFVRT